MSIQILETGDCRELLTALDADSVDSIVTDPPYGLGFMGKDWDHGVPTVEFWQAFLRVAKPGAYMLAFGGTRTYHRMACAIEDAGWEVRDCIMWLYGTGFPKSLNLDGEWKGWGTALKPAYEPIIVARKPLEGTVAGNVAKHGVGAMNIDACRIETEARPKREVAALRDDVEYSPNSLMGRVDGSLQSSKAVGTTNLGRWPANVIHDGSDEVLSAFPDAPGQQGDLNETGRARPTKVAFGDMAAPKPHTARIESDKSAARFFYCAKASKSEREAGLGELPKKAGGMLSNTSGQHITRRDGGAPGPRSNNHPTVKPLSLMRYLCKLVTPPNGVVLDPFMGSGSTGCAAVKEGFNFIGFDLDLNYVKIAEARITQASKESI